MEKNKYNIQEILLLLYVIYGTMICVIPSIGNIIGNYSIIINFAVGIILFVLNIKKCD